MKRKIKTLLKNLCCSRCKSDFDENSIEIVRSEADDDSEMLVVKLVCQNCGKSFGIAFLGVCDVDLKDEKDCVLQVQQGPPVITADDVLDAHKFIKNMDKDWQKYLEN